MANGDPLLEGKAGSGASLTALNASNISTGTLSTSRYTDVKWSGTSSGLTASTGRTSLGLGTAATRNAEDTLTDGSNLPDGAAVKAYGDANWSGGGTTYWSQSSNLGASTQLPNPWYHLYPTNTSASGLVVGTSSAFAGGAALDVTNEHGYQAIVGYAKRSGLLAPPTDLMSTAAFYGVTWNDYSGGVSGINAYGAFIEGQARNSNVTWGAEIVGSNDTLLTPKNPTPHNIFGTGTASGPIVTALILTNGGTGRYYNTKDTSSALGIYNNPTSEFYKGIVVSSTAIKSVGGHKEAIALPADNEITWETSGAAVGRLTCDGSTLNWTGTGTSMFTVAGAIYASGNISTSGVVIASCGTLTCDYVFEPGYDLLSIPALESFIEKENHLPGMTVNKGMDKLDLGKAVAELVVKAEEQSLYIIQLNNKNKKLESQLALLSDRLDKLEER